MAMRGNQLASETLDTSQHSLGCLLEALLVPTSNDLTFWEVIGCVLYENQHDSQHRLHDLVMCCTQAHQELNSLIEAHREASSSSQKRIKKEIDLRRKDLEGLRERISQQQSYLQEDAPEQDVPERDDLLDQGVESEMPTIPGANNAPSESAMAPVSGSPPSDDHAMEVDEGAVGLLPTSPVSREDDNLLTGNDEVGVEVGLAHLTVSSPSGQDREGEEASVMEVPPPLEEGYLKDSPVDRPRMASREGAVLMRCTKRHLMSRRWGADHLRRLRSDPSWRPMNLFVNLSYFFVFILFSMYNYHIV